MRNLYEILDGIRARPGMIIAGPSFASLKDFVSGYETALLFNRVTEHLDPPFSGFDHFVRTSLGKSGQQVTLVAGSHQINLGEIGWASAITEAAEDDQAAFKLFFELLSQFRGRTKRVA